MGHLREWGQSVATIGIRSFGKHIEMPIVSLMESNDWLRHYIDRHPSIVGQPSLEVATRPIEV